MKLVDQNKRLSKEENSKELFKKELVMFGWGSNDYGQLGCGTGIIIKYFHFTVNDFEGTTNVPHAGLTIPKGVQFCCMHAASLRNVTV